MPSFWNTFKDSQQFRWLSKLAHDVTLVDPADLREDDIIIAIMGPTGSGKSTFVSVATGNDRGIGDSLTSKTAEVTPFICKPPSFVNIGRDASTSRRIVFVDTPGFDDTNRSDSAILKEIARWLERSYRNSIYISGIIYMHRITDNRMAGTPLKNLKMFQHLCGPDFASKMLLVTTMWDEEEKEIGQKREAELRSSFWGELITRGADTTRFVDGNAWDVVGYLIRRSVAHQVQALLIQKELVFEDKMIPETSAGRTLEGEITASMRERETLLNNLLVELARNEKEVDPIFVFEECRKLKKSIRVDQQRLNKLKHGSHFKKLLHSSSDALFPQPHDSPPHHGSIATKR